MTIRYLQNPANSADVRGLDDSIPSDVAFITALKTQKFVDITGSWPPALTVAQAQTAQIELLDAAYAKAVATPVSYMGTTFQADSASQTAVAQAVAAGSVPAGFFWNDVNNNQVAMTFAQLQGLAAAILAQTQANYAHLQTQKAAVRAATTVAAVQAVVW